MWCASTPPVQRRPLRYREEPAKDRLKIVQAVAPAVPQRGWQASLQALDGALSLPLAAPVDALPGSAAVSVALQPRLSDALPGLRRYFDSFPYSGLEQKTSRAIALRDAAGWARLQSEAAGYLDSDGLAHYFPPSPGAAATGSDRLTAYLITAAHEAAGRGPTAPAKPCCKAWPRLSKAALNAASTPRVPTSMCASSPRSTRWRATAACSRGCWAASATRQRPGPPRPCWMRGACTGAPSTCPNARRGWMKFSA